MPPLITLLELETRVASDPLLEDEVDWWMRWILLRKKMRRTRTRMRMKIQIQMNNHWDVAS
jgi:hypothetical protein